MNINNLTKQDILNLFKEVEGEFTINDAIGHILNASGANYDNEQTDNDGQIVIYTGLKYKKDGSLKKISA